MHRSKAVLGFSDQGLGSMHLSKALLRRETESRDSFKSGAPLWNLCFVPLSGLFNHAEHDARQVWIVIWIQYDLLTLPESRNLLVLQNEVYMWSSSNTSLWCTSMSFGCDAALIPSLGVAETGLYLWDYANLDRVFINSYHLCQICPALVICPKVFCTVETVIHTSDSILWLCMIATVVPERLTISPFRFLLQNRNVVVLMYDLPRQNCHPSSQFYLLVIKYCTRSKEHQYT